MGFSAWLSARRVRSLAVGLSALCLGAACAGSKQKAAEAARDDDSGSSRRCHKNEVREYFCDDLLPLSSDKPAPEPYETCPGSVSVKGNVFPATSSGAGFDIPRTVWARKRAPPGHACCYSWCSTLAVADVDDADPKSCQQPNAMPERLCVSAAEAGVSDAAAVPNERCAGAVVPPPGVAFKSPKAAALDLRATAEKRDQGLSECCYGWCSKAPLGTGLGAK
jgi:hypothetical protein